MKIRMLLVFITLFMSLGHTQAQQDSLLEKSITRGQLEKVLLNDESWITYPDYNDRQAWDALVLPEVRKNIIRAGEKALKYQWKPDLATDYLAFKRQGKILTGRNNQKTLITLALAELVEGKGRFMDQIINGAWFLCEVSWVHSAHAYFQKDQSGLPDPDEPTVELVVADIGSEMSWLYYFFHEEFDKISPLIAKRLKNTVYERLIDPYFARSDYWWMGHQGQLVNNWNVWINYNVLQSVLLFEKDAEKRADYVYRLMRSVDRYIDEQHTDGTCEEGPTYFDHAGANLLKFLDLLSRSTRGAVNIFKEEKIKNIGRYIYRAQINGRYFVNFSDAGVICNVNPGAVYHYGKCIDDEVLMGFASDFARNNHWLKKVHQGSLFARVLDDVLMAKEIVAGKTMQLKELAYYFKEGQLATARDSKATDKGFYFTAHGSNNGVPHNHNDVGSCMLYYNGLPVLIDVGVGTYTRKTFSAERYTIWTMQSGYHNLPTINGMDQQNGVQFAAANVHFKQNKQNVWFSADIAEAYSETASADSWIRSYQLKRNREFTISDEWKLKEAKGDLILNLMTCTAVTLVNDGLLLKGNGFTLKLLYDVNSLSAKVETIALTDAKLKNAWGQENLYRIRLKVVHPSLVGKTLLTFKVVKN